jgi:hypothetical protein
MGKDGLNNLVCSGRPETIYGKTKQVREIYKLKEGQLKESHLQIILTQALHNPSEEINCWRRNSRHRLNKSRLGSHLEKAAYHY